MTHLEAIEQALPGRLFKIVAQNPDVLWVRAADFIAGAVFASENAWESEIAAAYNLLDDDQLADPITKEELWSLVLLVRVPARREDLARHIAQDLRYSRKVPYLEGDPIPKLIGPFSVAHSGGLPRTENPIENALRRVAQHGELPLLSSVLIGKDRRDKDEVERLLDLMEEGSADG